MSKLITTDEAVAKLTIRHAEGAEAAEESRGTYLCILVARTQQAINKRKLTTAQTVALFNGVHSGLYAVILQSLTARWPEMADADGLAQEERTRRSLARNAKSNFARTAKYYVEKCLEAGSDLTTVDASTITRSVLRDLSEPVEPKVRTKRLAQRAAARYVKALSSLAEIDKTAARRMLEEVLATLGPVVAKPLTKRRIKRGELTLTPHAH